MNRTSNEAVFPAQLMDVKAAIRYLRAHAIVTISIPGALGLWENLLGAI